MPKVSILLITYNHGAYIAEAIESILNQLTSYTYVIHVIEDCSTDNTQEVVMKYVREFPNIVIPHFNEQNIGRLVTQKNFFRGLKKMNGEYFAILEGDDYWSSKFKLQRQVDFLESNPEYVACSHNTIKIYQDGEQEAHRFLYFPNTPKDHDIERMIKIDSFFHSSSMMMRNVFQGNPPSYFSNRWSCDIFMNISICEYGKIRYFDEDMTVYRAHSSGLFSNMGVLEGWFFNIGGLQRYNAWLKFKYVDVFAESIIRYCSVVFNGAGHSGVRRLTIFEYTKYSLISIFYRLVYVLAKNIKLTGIYFLEAIERSNKKTNIFTNFSLLLLSFFLSILNLIYFNICYFVNYSLFLIFHYLKKITPEFLITRIRNTEIYRKFFQKLITYMADERFVNYFVELFSTGLIRLRALLKKSNLIKSIFEK